MSIPDVLPPSPPSTSSRRKSALPLSSVNAAHSPDSPASFPSSSNPGTRKRVEFSPWTNTHDPVAADPLSSSSSAAALLPVRNLPPSSACPSALKSILKPATVADAALAAAHGPQPPHRSAHEMMESLADQLSQDDRTVSVDAYRTLAGVIREYDEVPEEAILKSLINTLIKHIKRDLLRQTKPDEHHIADTNLQTQALKVLVIFVWNRDYAGHISDENRNFILDRAIQVLTERSAPKSVIIHYLHLLATQDFRPGLIAAHNRVGRLLEALKSLTEHVKGNGAVLERLLVYQKLMDQARAAMKAKSSLWIEELLTGMTSGLKDIRVKGITLGTKACAAFPASSSISVGVRAALARKLDDDTTFGATVCRRLEKMIHAKDEASQVPQIWTIVLLLSNSLEARIDGWSDLKDWLKVIQRCFNASESAVRQQANMAWNRFVYIVRPHEASESLAAMLAKPLSAQLERPATEKAVKSSRATAVSSYCNLLYYAFRPAATHKQNSRSWNEYIVKVMKSSLFEKNATNSDVACRVFIALMWNSSMAPKLWNENRALENSPVDPEELPTIDSKWIRARTSSILDMFAVLVRYSSWGASGQSDRAYIAVAWTNFLKAVREASSKEIKPSAETKHAVSSVVSFLSHLGSESRERSGPDHLSDAQIRQLTRIAVTELGTAALVSAIERTCGLQSLVLLEVIDAIVVDLKKAKEARSEYPNSRSSSQAVVSQYEKCLELIVSTAAHDIENHDAVSSAVIRENIVALEHLVDQIPQDHVSTMALLSPVLVTLLKDERGLLGSLLDEVSSPAYLRFIKTTMRVLGQLPPTQVVELDDVFAAALGSTHMEIVNEAVDVWNRTFGSRSDVTLGPRLKDALAKLEDFVGIDKPLAGSTLKHDAHVPISPPAPRELLPSPALGGQIHLHPGTTVFHDVTPSSHHDASGRKARHNDSQIQFVPIESSPLPSEDVESQFLTTHQKEVRDRQRSEPSVVFPDLASSPRPHGRSHSQNQSEFARKVAALEVRPSTPVLPTNHDAGEMEVMASPTPRSRHMTNQIADIEVPSSPPSLVDNQDKDLAGGEIMSSPPQGPIDEAPIGIDLAIPQPDFGLVRAVEICEPVVEERDLSQHDREEVQAAPSDPVIDREPFKGPSSPPFAGPELAPSTVDETVMTAPSDEAKRADNDSDDMEDLSASQLSQDLDRHLNQAAEDAALEEDSLKISAARVVPKGQAPPTRRSTRKRKSSVNSYATARAKRTRLSSESSSRRASESLEPEGSIVADSAMEDLYDTIEVAPSQAVQALASATPPEQALGDRSPLPTTPRRRRRARTSTRKSQAHEKASADVEVVVPSRVSESILYKDEMDNAESGVNGVRQHSPLEDVDHEGDSQRVSSSQIIATDRITGTACVDTSVETSTDVPVGRDHDRPNVVASLQAILDQMKLCAAHDIDLRAVDEMCFQIRFQAQVLSQKQSA